MDCESFCRQFWKKGDEEACLKCVPVMRALLMSLQKEPGQEGESMAGMRRGANSRTIHKLVKLDELDTVVDRLEWNSMNDALAAVEKSGIPKEQVEAIELILTEVKKRGYL
jgi:hypothetical protein